MPRLNETHTPETESVTMTFGEHLEELRRRLLFALAGVAVACVITFYFSQDIVAWLVVPLTHAQRAAGLPPQTIATRVMTGFALYMKVGLIGGVIVAFPWVLYQLWKFVSAGLYASERRVVALLTPLSAAMVALGVSFLYYIMLPLALMFLIAFSTTYPAPPADDTQPIFVERMMDRMPDWTRRTIDWINRVPARPAVPPEDAAAVAPAPASVPLLHHDPPTIEPGQMWVKLPENELRVALHDGVRTVPLPLATLINPMIEINDYVNFVMFMMLAVVIAFQVPVFMLIMGWTGLVDPQSIARYRRHCVFVCFVAAAILTPTGDPFNLMLLALPLWLLFELGLMGMRMTYRQRLTPRGDEDA